MNPNKNLNNYSFFRMPASEGVQRQRFASDLVYLSVGYPLATAGTACGTRRRECI